MFDKTLIKPIALSYNLPPELVEAIIQVESSGNPFAFRYEPAFFRKYVEGKTHSVPQGISRGSEEMARATSFGLMQVMGQVARENGFANTFLTELCDAETGIAAGCKQLSKIASRLPAEKYGWDAVCAAYNGGLGAVEGFNKFRNPEYPAKVLKALGGVWPQRG